MATITIVQTHYDVYADVDDADNYLQAAQHADAWRALTQTIDKQRALITATRALDRQKWLGEKTDELQVLQWPRTDTGVDGVEDDEIPQNIVDASIELALALVQGSEFQNEQNTAQKIASLGAGSAQISYFRGAEGAALRFPLIVQELIQDYLSGSAITIGASTSSGIDGESVMNNDFTFNEGV